MNEYFPVVKSENELQNMRIFGVKHSESTPNTPTTTTTTTTTPTTTTYPTTTAMVTTSTSYFE